MGEVVVYDDGDHTWADEECGYVLQLNSSQDRCDFVRQCQDCLDGAGRLADYTQLYFCTFHGQ